VTIPVAESAGYLSRWKRPIGLRDACTALLKGLWSPIALLSPGPDDSLQGNDRNGAGRAPPTAKAESAKGRGAALRTGTRRMICTTSKWGWADARIVADDERWQR
jgi:hypothetical protein